MSSAAGVSAGHTRAVFQHRIRAPRRRDREGQRAHVRRVRARQHSRSTRPEGDRLSASAIRPEPARARLSQRRGLGTMLSTSRMPLMVRIGIFAATAECCRPSVTCTRSTKRCSSRPAAQAGDARAAVQSERADRTRRIRPRQLLPLRALAGPTASRSSSRRTTPDVPLRSRCAKRSADTGLAVARRRARRERGRTACERQGAAARRRRAASTQFVKAINDGRRSRPSPNSSMSISSSKPARRPPLQRAQRLRRHASEPGSAEVSRPRSGGTTRSVEVSIMTENEGAATLTPRRRCGRQAEDQVDADPRRRIAVAACRPTPGERHLSRMRLIPLMPRRRRAPLSWLSHRRAPSASTAPSITSSRSRTFKTESGVVLPEGRSSSTAPTAT